ncbi:OmpH family outer membrane protein [Cloacibacillus sp.]|uniref:OmpH family outer membrane protein n=1 Tax=Cloacibacillus sp. TaxID=2049023 RepID=UPI0025BF1BEB|nr:OmpH family outer membrane protein [Cloacibacillus sp.]MCC8057293.1 OmpH family outer membrane protein [Cloacibacillus sp.]MCC8179149.1 OmpH family outer membrane protein [Cloacibacillus sp.]
MKKTAALLLAIAALFAFGAISYAADDTVGYVDDMGVLQQFSKFQQAQKQLDELGKKKSNTAKAAFDKESDEKKKSEIVQNLQFEMREEEAKLMNPVLKEVNDTIAKVAKQKGVTIVVNKALVYYGGIDLTQDVVNALKK